MKKEVIPANAGVILTNSICSGEGKSYPRECWGDPESQYYQQNHK